MKKAIKAIENRIEALKYEMIGIQKAIDEPEMISDYTFGMADLGNMESEIIELEGAIKILNGILTKG